MNATTICPVLLGVRGDTISEDEWLALRREGIGGSDAADIAGAGYGSPMSVYIAKLGLTEPTPVNEAMEWGTRLEGVVVAKFEEVSACVVTDRQAMYRHPEHEFMFATIDGSYLTADGVPELYEGKTAGAHMQKEWSEEPPLGVWVQVQHNLCVTGLSAATVAVLIGGRHYQQYRVERSDEYIARLVELERRFVCDHLRTFTPPPVDGSNAAAEALDMLYPKATDYDAELPAEAELLVSDYLARKVKAREAEDGVRAAENALKELLGEHDRGLVGGWAVEWRNRSRRSIDVKALAVAHPDIAEAFQRTTEYRQFAVKERKDDE